ncbi:4'-phosphopantetheinyl transferase Svp [Streptomyces sp. RB5]|uniref:4'-phosphopantetheinyl transferase Svp n=1 Tax=Streptomyces smaragdinus TaxID=2585196 RepID=A0A7K0CLG8_9ACTN|nr:4'-phosphopantetheinyl transferase superfamily protein [Streptomyces smaragdinus]MQY14103.1 4'-phosphopantetheinyl transferase Svp [Streptomyces smaragdinus]
MLTEIVPACVATVETTSEPADAPLHPAEAALVAHAVTKRRLEFASVRWCARQAMARLGLAPGPVLPGHRGVPQWAPGVVGSMTHCAGYRAAALAYGDDLAALGIDAEPNAPLPDGLLESIALPQELRWVRALTRTRPEVCWDRLLFSIKEAVYKTWFPLTGHELDFHDALVAVDPATGAFRAALLPDRATLPAGAPRGFAGRWAAAGGLVVSATWVPARVRTHESAPRARTGSAV